MFNKNHQTNDPYADSYTPAGIPKRRTRFGKGRHNNPPHVAPGAAQAANTTTYPVGPAGNTTAVNPGQHPAIGPTVDHHDAANQYKAVLADPHSTHAQRQDARRHLADMGKIGEAKVPLSTRIKRMMAPHSEEHYVPPPPPAAGVGHHGANYNPDPALVSGQTYAAGGPFIPAEENHHLGRVQGHHGLRPDQDLTGGQVYGSGPPNVPDRTFY